MKALTVLFMALLSLAAVVGAFVEADEAQRLQLQQAATAAGQQFTIPGDSRLADPDKALAAVGEAATVGHVNVFRTVIAYDADGRQQTTHYILLTAHTRLFDALGLQSGRWLTADDTEHPGRFLSSVPSSDVDQVGVLRDFAGNDQVFVRGLGTAFNAVPVAGTYVMEAADQASADRFFETLATATSRAAGEPGLFTPESFKPNGGAGVSYGGGWKSILTAVQIMIIVATAFLLAFWVLHEGKRAGIMKLHGKGPVGVWWELAGRRTLVVFLVTGTVAVAASLLVRDSGVGFVESVGVAVLRVCVVMLIASGVACAYVARASVSDALKNRKDTRAVFAVNNLLKIGCSIAVIATTAGVSTQLANASAERQRLGNWERARGYGIFYPLSNGNDLEDILSGGGQMRRAETTDLYPIVNGMGSLFIDATGYEPLPPGLENPPEVIPSMVVNLNYLARFPILDHSGKEIEIRDDDPNWIILAPGHERAREAEIRSYFKAVRKDPARPAGQKFDIIWTMEGQAVFSFDPLINPGDGNNIVDPIIEVMTSANSVPGDRDNMLTGDPNSGLKVRLLDGDTTRTAQELAPALQRLKLDDNLRHLVTMDAYASKQIADLDFRIGALAAASFALIAGLLLLAIQSMSILFQHYSRRITVRRLLGADAIRASREVWLIFGAVWIVQLAGALLINQFAENPTGSASTAVASDALVVAIAVAVAVVEGLFSAAVLSTIARRGAVRVLKEEF